MTKSDIINEITLATGVQKKDVTAVVEGFMETIKTSLLEKKENVYLRGVSTASSLDCSIVLRSTRRLAEGPGAHSQIGRSGGIREPAEVWASRRQRQRCRPKCSRATNLSRCSRGARH